MTKIVKNVLTMDVAYLQRMPAGIPGDINRAWATLAVFPEIPSEANPIPQYGVAVQVDADGKMEPIGAGSVAADIYGVIARPYPLQQVETTGYSGAVNLGPASAVPPTKGTIDVMKQGCMTVKLNGDAAATKGGTAYIWIAASAGTHVQGGWEAAAAGADTIEAPATFRGPADADGNVEILFNKFV
jgi:uncharacterized Zn-binding protein involved in type VI secretion